MSKLDDFLNKTINELEEIIKEEMKQESESDKSYLEIKEEDLQALTFDDENEKAMLLAIVSNNTLKKTYADFVFTLEKIYSGVAIIEKLEGRKFDLEKIFNACFHDLALVRKDPKITLSIKID